MKKYTERRVEDRRHTEISDAGKLDTTRWTPLPKNVPRGQQLGATKRPSRDERQENVDESAANAEKWSAKPISEDRSSKIEPEVLARSHYAIRSHSTDVTALKRPEKSITEQRRHTDCSDPRTIATRLTEHIFHVRKREIP